MHKGLLKGFCLKLTVDISDAKMSSDPSDQLVTYSLGSCIGVTVYDPNTKVGGLLHFQLPSSRTDRIKSNEKPFMFADTGMTTMMKQLTSMGAKKGDLKVKLAGGAAIMASQNGNIGKRNYAAIRQLLWKNGMFIDKEDIGGTSPRNVTLDINTGKVTIKSLGVETNL